MAVCDYLGSLSVKSLVQLKNMKLLNLLESGMFEDVEAWQNGPVVLREWKDAIPEDKKARDTHLLEGKGTTEDNSESEGSDGQVRASRSLPMVDQETQGSVAVTPNLPKLKTHRYKNYRLLFWPWPQWLARKWTPEY